MRAALLAVLIILAASPAGASDRDAFLRAGAGYVSAGTVTQARHGGTLGIGAGYAVTDFSVADLTLRYAAVPGDEFVHLADAEAAFRLLIDATEWVPSIAATSGWLAWYDTTNGFDEGTFHYGAAVCVEYRTTREKSVSVCGAAQTFPFADALSTFYLAELSFNGYLPWLFE